MKVLLLLLSIISLAVFIGIRTHNTIDLNVQLTGHLKRAADANTIELAKKELDTSIKYLEDHKLTEGYVSIFLKQPKNDIGFWYDNLKASRAELEVIKADATPLEKSNVLMKLRETLLDQGESTHVTMPDGLDVYPNNPVFFWWITWTLIILIFSGGACLIEYGS